MLNKCIQYFHMCIYICVCSHTYLYTYYINKCVYNHKHISCIHFSNQSTGLLIFGGKWWVRWKYSWKKNECEKWTNWKFLKNYMLSVSHSLLCIPTSVAYLARESSLWIRRDHSVTKSIHYSSRGSGFGSRTHMETRSHYYNSWT